MAAATASRRWRRVRGDGDATPSTPSIGAATGRRKTDAAKGPLEVLTGAPSMLICCPDAFSSNSTCALPLLQLAKWPQCDLMECWAACQFRWTSPPKSQVVSSHNAHLIIEPSTTNCRRSSPLTAVNLLPTIPLFLEGSLTNPSTLNLNQSSGAISLLHARTSSALNSMLSTCVLRTSITSPVVVFKSIQVCALPFV